MHVSLGGMEGIKTIRITGTGLILTGACHIYWMTVSPNNTTNSLAISDGTATGTAKWSASSAIGQAFPVNFGKPMEMKTGIYCETFTNEDACTVGYAIP